MRSVVAAAAVLMLATACDGEGAVSSVTAAPDTAAPSVESSTPTSTESPTEASSAPSTESLSTTSPTQPTQSTSPPVVPAGFEQTAATVTTAAGTVCELCLWVAATNDQRAQGLMFVTDLGGPDGMVFRYAGPTTGAFWMKNTVMPLSIAFFAADGRYLDGFDMEPCVADPCATYPTPADFVDAIEVPQGALAELGIEPGSTLVVHDLPCDET